MDKIEYLKSRNEINFDTKCSCSFVFRVNFKYNFNKELKTDGMVNCPKCNKKQTLSNFDEFKRVFNIIQRQTKINKLKSKINAVPKKY